MHAHPKYWSLGAKLPATLALVVMAVAITIGLALVIQERDRQRLDLAERAALLARSVATSAAEPMLRSDYWSLYRNLAQMTAGQPHHHQIVLTGFFLDKDGRVAAHLRPRDNPIGLLYRATDDTERTRMLDLVRRPDATVAWIGGDVVEATFPILANQSVLGLAVLRFSAAEIGARTLTASFVILGIALTLAILGSAIGAFVSNRMVRPLRELAGAMGSVVEGEAVSVPIVDAHDHDEIGQLVQAFNRMSRDLAQKRVLEQEAATSEKLVALGRISAGVAHEINNPLGGMLNCIDTIEKFPDDPRLFERYLPIIKKGLYRIHGIVRSLLVELRAEDGFDWTSGACLDDIRELIDAEVQGRDIRVVWSNKLGCETHLQCRRVQQVVFNLLRNAIDAIEGSGTVAFRAFSDHEQAVIEVEDDGVGIPTDNISRLFDPFFTSKPNGTGLGLWITYRLVESMRGSIEVASDPGKGSLFRITLPVQSGVIDRSDHGEGNPATVH